MTAIVDDLPEVAEIDEKVAAVRKERDDLLVWRGRVRDDHAQARRAYLARRDAAVAAGEAPSQEPEPQIALTDRDFHHRRSVLDRQIDDLGRRRRLVVAGAAEQIRARVRAASEDLTARRESLAAEVRTMLAEYKALRGAEDEADSATASLTGIRVNAHVRPPLVAESLVAALLEGKDPLDVGQDGDRRRLGFSGVMVDTSSPPPEPAPLADPHRRSGPRVIATNPGVR